MDPEGTDTGTPCHSHGKRSGRSDACCSFCPFTGFETVLTREAVGKLALVVVTVVVKADVITALAFVTGDSNV